MTDDQRRDDDLLIDTISKRTLAGCGRAAKRKMLAKRKETTKEESTDPRAAFEKLTLHVLPAEQDEPKRKAMSFLMMGLRELRNPSAHGHFETQVERAEAELALTVAVALFRYIGEVMAKRA